MDGISLEWYYLDSTNQEFGPFPADTMHEWFSQGFFPIGEELLVRLPGWKQHVPLRIVYPDMSVAFKSQPNLRAVEAMQQGAANMTMPGVGMQGAPRGPGGAQPFDGFDYAQFGGQGGMAPYPGQPGANYGMPAMQQANNPGAKGGGRNDNFQNPQAAYGGMPSYNMGGAMGMGGGGMPGGGGAMGGAMAVSGTGQRFCGRVKSFNAKQGFGFIECPDAHARFGRDVFLHKAQVGDLKVGSEVMFGVEPNKQGMPQARDITTMDGRPPGPSPQGKGGGGKDGAGRRGNPGGGGGYPGNNGGGSGRGPGGAGGGRGMGGMPGGGRGDNKGGGRGGRNNGQQGGGMQGGPGGPMQGFPGQMPMQQSPMGGMGGVMPQAAPTMPNMAGGGMPGGFPMAGNNF